MPREFRLVQLRGEAFSLDIPLHRIMGYPKSRNGEFLPFPALACGTPANRQRRRSESGVNARNFAVFCELAGRDFPHQDEWLPGMDSNGD
jgi:hypothetical protein